MVQLGNGKTLYTYSRQERHYRKIENSCLDGQIILTDYYSVLTRMENVMKENTEFTTQLSSAFETIENHKYDNVHGLLKHLLDTAVANNGSKFRNRFSDVLKKFCLYVYLVGGQMLYELLHRNMAGVFPAMSTLYTILDESPQIGNAVLRMEQLKTYLEKRNLPKKIFISEDQTAIIKRVQYMTPKATN